MEITTVKLQQNGHLVNGHTFIPKDEKNFDYLKIKEWLKDGNIPEPEFTDEEINLQRIANIKQKAGEIIYSRYNEIQQRNILMSQDSEAIAVMNSFISGIRDISNIAETDGTVLEDINWGI